MKGTFISNLILLVGLNLLVKPLYLLVVEAEIQNRAGAEEFGMYFALLNITFILNIITDLGITNHNTRMIASEASIQSSQLMKMMKLKALLGILFMAALFITGFVLQYNAHQIYLLVILGISQVFASAILFLRSYLTGMHLFKHDSVISILDKIILLALMTCLLLIHHDTFKVEWLIYGQLIAYGLTCLVAIGMISRKYDKQQNSSDTSWISVLKDSTPYATLIIISMFAYRTDTVMLERMKGSRDAGIYAMGFRFFEALNMISYLFAVLLLPMFTRMLSKREDVTALIHTGLKIMFTGTWTVVLLSFVVGEGLLSMVYDHHIEEASLPFVWLMISAMFFSLQYITGTLITASGKMKILIMVATIGLLFNLSMNILLIPRYGAEGCAKASAITQGLMFIAQLIYVSKHFNHKTLWPEYIRAIAYVVLSTLPWAFQGIRSYAVVHPTVAIVSCGLICLLAAYATGMLEYKPFLVLLKSRFQREET